MQIRAIVWMMLIINATSLSAKPPLVRSMIPIKEDTLSDGIRRYNIPIKIGSTQIFAGLDTGSSGLRVLQGAIKPTDIRETSEPDQYAFDSGAELKGYIAKSLITVGDLSQITQVQLVKTIDCNANNPKCPASQVNTAQYGIQGDGLPGQGFKAIIGVSMANAEMATPLRAVGAQRWIIDLPRPGEAEGQLILNPTDAEITGYTMLPIAPEFNSQRGGLHDAISGCISNNVSKQHFCGPLMLDTGSPGIYVSTDERKNNAWPKQTPAMIVFYDGHGHAKAKESIITDFKRHASNFAFLFTGRLGPPRIYTGLTAYFAFSVLYDPAHGLIGLKPRNEENGGPKGELVPDGQQPIPAS